MDIKSINSTPNFKSALPVFVMLRMNQETVVPVVGETLNDTFMRKTEYLLNNTLKRGINSRRDEIVDKFRARFKGWADDFGKKVTAFTCVDGGIENGKLKPYFYFLTGNTRNSLEKLRQDHKNAVVISQGYQTANLKVAKDNYYNKGKQLVMQAFENFHPMGGKPQAMVVTYVPLRNKRGAITDYQLYNAELMQLNDINNPSIDLNKSV